MADPAVQVFVGDADTAADVLVRAVVAVASVGSGVAVEVGTGEADGVRGTVECAGIARLATGGGVVTARHAVALAGIGQRIALARSAVCVGVALAAAVPIGSWQKLGVVEERTDPAHRSFAGAALGAVRGFGTR